MTERARVPRATGFPHPGGLLARRAVRRLCFGLLLALGLIAAPAVAARAAAVDDGAQQDPAETEDRALSPYWGLPIQRWSGYIAALSRAYGFHPDFIAAVIRHESSGDHDAVSYMGAVGLMGVMPAGPGLEWRPSAEELLAPSANLRWGMAILSYVVQQSGGDLFTALAAYNGGWDQVNSRVPREYAAQVLDSYGRALLARNGLSPDAAQQWTLAVEVRAGNVPDESLLVLGEQPLSGYRRLVPHTVYAHADRSGRGYFIRGYVVPVGLSEMVSDTADVGTPDALEAPLRARLGDKAAKQAPGSERILLACLPSLTRLRGQVTTRWYGPAGCPAPER